jgi:phage terminase small subunit
MKLTPKQECFAKEYLIDLNATQAAIRAGYSAKRAKEIGHQQLQKPLVQEAIQRAMDERSKRTEITADFVLQGLAHIANDDIKNYLDFRTEKQLVGEDPETGEPVYKYSQVIEMKNSKDIDTRNVQEVSFSPKDGFKFKLYDKQKAFVDLGRHLKLFTEKVEHSGTIINQNIDLSSFSMEELKNLAKLDE